MDATKPVSEMTVDEILEHIGRIRERRGAARERAINAKRETPGEPKATRKGKREIETLDGDLESLLE